MSENESDCPFEQYQNICSALFGFVTKHARDRRTERTDSRTDGQTDKRTDGQNYGSQDRVSIAPRAVKIRKNRDLLLFGAKLLVFVLKGLLICSRLLMLSTKALTRLAAVPTCTMHTRQSMQGVGGHQ